MLTIIVGPVKETIITVDGKKFRVYPILIEEDNELRYLQNRLDFAGVKEVEIFAVRWFLPFRAFRLKLTPEVTKGIMEFLHRYHTKQNLFFNCYSFVSLVCGVEWSHGQGLWRKFWNIKPCRWWCRVGDVVFLVNHERKHFHHAAIYIGLGLYLSVYGGGGDLEVATLKDMKRDYRAKDVVLVVPRA